MNARILTILTATLVSIGGLMHAGEKPPTAFFAGAWSGYDTEKNSAATGGSINLTISPAESERFANVSGTIEVPDLRRHIDNQPLASTVIFREITGRLNLRTGAILAKCDKGIIRGHLDRNGHGAVGRLRVNSGRFILHGAYFADENTAKGAIN